MDPLFNSLPPEEFALLKREASRRLLIITDIEDPARYIEETLDAFRDPDYKVRFFRTFDNLHDSRFRGIALSRSVLKTIYNEMKLRRSVFLFFAEENAKRDPRQIALRKALRNAPLIFAALPLNFKTNL